MWSIYQESVLKRKPACGRGGVALGLTVHAGFGGAAQALSNSASQFGALLPMWAGGLMLAAYGLFFAAAGSRFGVRRDIT